MKPVTNLVIAAFATIVLVPVTGLAQNARNQGYLVNSDNNDITTSSNTGLCWRDSEWTSARAVAPCDPTSTPVAAAVPAPRPATVAVAPPAAPSPVAAEKPLPQKMSFSADALFDFDKAVLKPKGRAMLDNLVSQLNGATYDRIVVTGYTDRFGSARYNQKLSVRRAEAVKDYLVSRDIPASRIDAEGKGKAQPATKAGDCPGARSARVIACLQPDRRVDVEMHGTTTVTSLR